MPSQAKVRSSATRRSGVEAESAFRAFWQAASRLRRLGEIRFGEFGLSPAQWRVLRVLHERAGQGDRAVRATDLCAELLLTKATVSGLLARLRRLGLVSRSKLASDHRAQAVTLTDAGHGIVTSILADHASWADALMDGLTAAEQRSFTRLLNKLRQWLDPMVREATGGAGGGAGTESDSSAAPESSAQGRMNGAFREKLRRSRA